MGLILKMTLGSCIPTATSPGQCQNHHKKGLSLGLLPPGHKGILWKLELKASGVKHRLGFLVYPGQDW